MRFVIEVIKGPHQGLRYELDNQEQFLVGRGVEAHLRLAQDKHFSRKHFLLEPQPLQSQCKLTDLSSTHGTWVKGRRVRETMLEPGDIISGGQTEIRISEVDEPHDQGEATDIEDQWATLAPVTRLPNAEINAIPSASRIPPSAVSESTPPSEDARSPSPIPELSPPPSANSPLVSGAAPGLIAALTGRPLSHVPPAYELIRPLGRGGMGMVSLVRGRANGKLYALKVILPASAANKQMMRMFLREANVLSQLDHSRIVRLHEMGMTTDSLFIAMDYVDAIDPWSLLRRLDPEEGVRTSCAIIHQVLEGLAYAHGKGFVHRDVKPSNILIARNGHRLHAYLADFGLAKNFENAGFSDITVPGAILGTLGYAGPELVKDAKLVKPSVDIYSAAATLYHYLSGQSPHEFPGAKHKLVAICEDEPVPIRQHRPDVPEALAEVIHRALAKDPAQRYATAEEMRQALRPFHKA